MKSFTLTVNLPDDACCPDCLKLIEIDETVINVYVGDCECGREIILEPTVDIEWGDSH